MQVSVATWIHHPLEQESAEAELINTKISISIISLESSKTVVLGHSVNPFTYTAAVANETNGYHEPTHVRDPGPFYCIGLPNVKRSWPLQTAEYTTLACMGNYEHRPIR